MSFEEIKQRYISTFVQKQTDLKAAWDDKNVSELHHLLHKLAGSSGGYGFNEMSLLCRQAMALTVDDEITDADEIEKNLTELFVILLAEN